MTTTPTRTATTTNQPGDKPTSDELPGDELLEAAAGSPRIHAVVDTTGAVLQQLPPSRFTNLSAGRVGVLARPGMRRASWLASDILSALGCSELVTGAGRPGDGDLDLAVTWLRTHRVQNLYVQFAWSVHLPVLVDAAEAARRAGCHLWLVGDTPYTDLHREYLEPYAPLTWIGPQFLRYWLAQTASPSDTSGHGEPSADVISKWPDQVPADDFTTFRSACREQLSPRQFTLVDEHLIACHQRAIVGLTPMLDASRDCLVNAERSVASWLAAEWEDSISLQHFIVLVRAAQVAAFHAGYYLQVDLDQLIGTASTMPRRALRNPQVWARLRAYPEPHRGAACALAAAGMGVAMMTRLRVDGYDADTGVVAVDGQRFTVEEAARLYVRAQQIHRQMSGADPSGPMFATAKGEAIRERALATVIKMARRELGIAVTTARIDRIVPDEDRWMRRWGLSIQELL